MSNHTTYADINEERVDKEILLLGSTRRSKILLFCFSSAYLTAGDGNNGQGTHTTTTVSQYGPGVVMGSGNADVLSAHWLPGSSHGNGGTALSDTGTGEDSRTLRYRT